MAEFADHIIEDHLGDAEAVVVANEGQIEAPEGWVLESTTYCNGKRIRHFSVRELT